MQVSEVRRLVPFDSILKMKSSGRALSLSQLASVMGSRHEGPDVEIQSLSTDTRALRPGALFFAVPGCEDDGWRYVDEALRRGALAVVSDRYPDRFTDAPFLLVEDVRRAKAHAAAAYYDHPSCDLNVVGITGTNGKTSTAYMLKSLLEHDGAKTGMLGTVGYDTGRGMQPSTMTTPDAIELHRSFAEMVDRGCRNAVMEVSSHALTQDRVEAVQFRAGVFTNLSLDHLDYHRTMEAYRDAKSMLFEKLDSTAFAVFNGQDPVTPILRERCQAKVMTFGVGEGDYDVQARLRRMDIDGMSFDLHSPWGSIDVTSRFVGEHNLANALAASTTALAMGVSLPAIKGAFEALTMVPGRLEPVDRGQDFRVLVDYAHTDAALSHVLSTLRPLTRGRLIVVFGCGGNRDRSKRPLMGRVASRCADLAIVTSDNPRKEEPSSIIEEILVGMDGDAERVVEVDRRRAIAQAIAQARGGDIVLLAGKGHEDYQVIGNERSSFDDRQVAEEELWKRGQTCATS